jgi:predicted RNA methylase
LAERATLLAALPDLRGKSVLDVACGTGFYPRAFRRLGADPVVGVDSFCRLGGVLEAALTRAGLHDVTRHATVVPEDGRGEEFRGPPRRGPSFAVFTGRA